MAKAVEVGLVPSGEADRVLLDYIIRALTGGTYCVKRNPWEKISKHGFIKPKKPFVLSLVPDFAKARGGKRPPEVEAINDILAWAARKLSCVHPEYRDQIIRFYMMNVSNALEGKSDEEIEKMSAKELEGLLGDALRDAVATVFNLPNVPATVDEAVRIAREKAPAEKVCNGERLTRKISKKKLVAVSRKL